MFNFAFFEILSHFVGNLGISNNLGDFGRNFNNVEQFRKVVQNSDKTPRMQSQIAETMLIKVSFQFDAIRVP